MTDVRSADLDIMEMLSTGMLDVNLANVIQLVQSVIPTLVTTFVTKKQENVSVRTMWQVILVKDVGILTGTLTLEQAVTHATVIQLVP